MPSIVHGPGTREGMAADIAPRPTSVFDCVGSRVPQMDKFQTRRMAMFVLRHVCSWRLEDIGKLFDKHKGHVSREIDRARLEAAKLLKSSGVETLILKTAARPGRRSRIICYMTADERRQLADVAAAAGMSQSEQMLELMKAGGLAPSAPKPIEQEDVD